MKRMRKTVITIESIQRTTIRSGKRATLVLCERCAAETYGESAERPQSKVIKAFRKGEAVEAHLLEAER